MGDSYALTVTLKVFSDLIPPGRGPGNTNPGNINLVDARGTLATVNNAGMPTTNFSRIGLDPNVGWSSSSSDFQRNMWQKSFQAYPGLRTRHTAM